MGLLDHLRDAASTPAAFFAFADFIRQDDVADGGAADFTAIATGTFATSAANGGWGRLSGAATTDNSGGQLQLLAAHACTTGKTLAMKARAQIGEATTTNAATDSDLFIGLFPVDTSIEASLPDNGIYFSKPDGGTAIKAIVRVAGANVVEQTLSVTADKDVHTYGISVQPNGTDSTVTFSIDGVAVARCSGISLPADTVILTPTIAFQSGDNTGTKYIDVDYVGSYQAR